MLFEVFRAGQRLAWTECAQLVPDKDGLTDLIRAGLTVKIDGKTVRAGSPAGRGKKTR